MTTGAVVAHARKHRGCIIGEAKKGATNRAQVEEAEGKEDLNNI